MFSDEEIGRLATWIATEVDPAITAVEVAFVLKAPEIPSVVYQRDAGREARILDAVGRLGAPVPAVLAIDDGSRTIGRHCFLMEHVGGRSVSDAPPGPTGNARCGSRSTTRSRHCTPSTPRTFRARASGRTASPTSSSTGGPHSRPFGRNI